MTIKGDITVHKDLIGNELVTLFYTKFKQFSISGNISAPVVEIKYRSVYTNLYEIPRKIYSIFGLKRRAKREVVFENIKVNSDLLKLSSYFNPDEIIFTFSDTCEIEAKKIEFLRDDPHPKRERKLISFENDDEFG